MGKFDGEFGNGTQTYAGTARVRYYVVTVIVSARTILRILVNARQINPIA